MNTRPGPPPEGKLIAEAADNLNLSIREAARRAGISYGRWRQIVTGYQNVSPGEYAKVHAPAKTVAKMAQVVGVEPDELEKAGRADAAAELRNLTEPRAETFTPTVSDHADDEVRLPPDVAAQMADTALRSVAPEIRIRAESALSRNESATGRDIFPQWPRVAEVWDAVEGLTFAERVVYASAARLQDLREEWRNRRSG